jgi:hypothetical protein
MNIKILIISALLFSAVFCGYPEVWWGYFAVDSSSCGEQCCCPSSSHADGDDGGESWTDKWRIAATFSGINCVDYGLDQSEQFVFNWAPDNTSGAITNFTWAWWTNGSGYISWIQKDQAAADLECIFILEEVAAPNKANPEEL